MLPMMIVAVVLLLFCGVGKADDSADPEGFYREACKKHHPDCKTISVYFHQNTSCSYACSGQNDNGKNFFESYPKANGITCSYGLQDPRHEQVPLECFNQECVRSDSIQACKKKTNGNLQSFIDNECELICDPSKPNDKIIREEGSHCTIKDRFYRSGKCTANRMCKEKRNYVSDPNGGTVANMDAINATCTFLHPNAIQLYSLPLRDNCEFLCIYTDDNVTIKIDILSFANGYTCDNGLACLGGRATDPKDVKLCNRRLKPYNEQVQRLDQVECDINCRGTTRMEKAEVPANSTCAIMVNDYWGQEGKCDDYGECVVPK